MNEEEVRELRVKIYGPISDQSWEAVRDGWMRGDSVKWLQERILIPLPDRPCTCKKKRS